MSKSAFVKVCAAAALLCAPVLTPVLPAQSPRAAQANQDAYNLYLGGNYEEAAKAYAQLLKDFPTDLLVPLATVQLGFSNFFLGEFDQALDLLNKAKADPAIPSELLPVIASFIPQVLAARAAAMPPDEAGRKPAFEDAIEKFGDYLKEFPQGAQVESVTYGRALANYQIGNYDATVDDLESNLKRFAKSPSIMESQNLLAITLATLGSKELADADKGDRDRGIALYSRAKQLLQEITDGRADLTLVNDARFQLAEILFSEAAFAPEEDRPALYAKAMEAYRAVAPNEEMVTLQQEKLAGMPERRRQVVLSRNQAAIAAFDREIEREQRRLGELMAKPDMLSTASLKMAEIRFHDGDLNKSRVLLRHIMPFLTKDEDKKRALYFLTMTYALQNVADSAVFHYDQFQSEFKGDPLAQNLPLAMGTMFLNHPNPATRSPERAIEYFTESLEIYPAGQLAGLSTVMKASAQTRLNQHEEAEQTFLKFLEGSPTPQEQLSALVGLAEIYRMTGQWDKAIETFQQVIEKFPDTEQAVLGQFWIALGTQQKGDNAGAIPLLQKFLEEHPETELAPNAMYSLAGAQVAVGETAAGIETFAGLAEKHPASDPAPFTYFMRAQLFAREGKMDEVNAMMREFIEKYPQNDRIFFAYDSIAQNAYRTAQWETAISTYREFVEKYPADPRAAEALLRISEFSRQWAESLGRYTALTTEERELWRERIEASVVAAEQMLAVHPDSPQLALGIQSLIASQRHLLVAELKSQSELETYFEGLAEASADDGVRSKVLFGLATYIAEQDSDRALEIMTGAYNPDILYAPADLDTFGLALIEQGELEKAAAVFAKLAADYPNPDDTQPQGAPAEIQQAQAIALFGRARVAQEQGETAAAGELFNQLKTLYGWSPKVLEAELGIAEAEFEAGELDRATGRLPGIIRAPNATAELRAKAMLLGGHVMKKRFETSRDEKVRTEALGAAIDYYIKIDQFYSGVPTIAAQGLFEGGQMLEVQAGSSNDAAFRQKQLGLARRAYEDLISKYPNSPFVDQARQRLNALGGG